MATNSLDSTRIEVTGIDWEDILGEKTIDDGVVESATVGHQIFDYSYKVSSCEVLAERSGVGLYVSIVALFLWHRDIGKAGVRVTMRAG